MFLASRRAAGDREGSPVERMDVGRVTAAHHLSFAQRLGSGLSLGKLGEEVLREPLACLLIDRPQGGNHRPGASELERLPHPRGGLAAVHVAQASLAGGEHDQFRATQVAVEHLGAMQPAVFVLVVGMMTAIATGECQLGVQQRILGEESEAGANHIRIDLREDAVCNEKDEPRTLGGKLLWIRCDS